ncbi:hypothetical protein MRX96_015503 [Rhipicephalus microplus]|uniref:Uncharacterized protein n=1 Tax=Rhipicephalus microplus TaxID=6941 RepID=A0A9J6E3G6_RHIMP|nr:hypothetical protein HPB51_019236 [Rhipicephalus microplus]
MDRRSFKKKRKTAQRFGARKPKPPIVKKKFSPATSASSDDGVRHDEDSQPSTSTHRASSASIDETVHMPVEQCFVLSEETSVRRSAQVADIVDAQPSTSQEDVLIADAQPSTSREDVDIADAQPSTSREDVDIADAQPSTSREDARPSTSTTSSTIRARLEPRFVSAEATRERAAAVQESLRAVSATEGKMSLMDQGDESDI